MAAASAGTAGGDGLGSLPAGEGEGEPAVDPAILAIEGDAAFGAYLAGECVTCHQASGADEGIPRITGWPRDRFVRALYAYRSKHRSNPVMQLIAAGLTAEEIAALAAYFEGAD
ncbi:MAG: c-type cytochrome [Pseudomonadota bacterium]